ncbi:hypothetical protein HMPREF9019_0691 [Hoylesella timonensis CRIS 5C-B1]|uniref:Uncharacterized protein n=1 Tax=Hoylesella timonensis CRIS 5C-B1 TaxID=679189 RepID=D1VWK1_9BACT|nr:hypothetical protein HMPREF9019_0691 [Hoylesella timonensis CRIS 5C-B1]
MNCIDFVRCFFLLLPFFFMARMFCASSRPRFSLPDAVFCSVAPFLYNYYHKALKNIKNRNKS